MTISGVFRTSRLRQIKGAARVMIIPLAKAATPSWHFPEAPVIKIKKTGRCTLYIVVGLIWSEKPKNATYLQELCLIRHKIELIDAGLRNCPEIMEKC